MESGVVTDPNVVLKQLSDQIDSALDVRLNCLHIDDLGDWVCRVESQLASKFAALQAKSVAAADDAALAPRNGVRATDQYVAARVPVDPATVRADGRIGVWLGDFPILERQFQRGRLSREHVEFLRKADNPRIQRHMIDAQEFFTRIASEFDWVDFGNNFGYWLLAADPDGEQPKEQLAQRRFTLKKNPDGTWRGSFRLDPIAGSAVNTAISHEANRLRDDDNQANAHRTSVQRNADALTNIVTRGAKRNPKTPLPAPLVHVTVGQLLAEDMVREAARRADARDNGEVYEAEPLIASGTDPNRRCELADGTPIHPHMAMAVLAVANFKRLVLDPDSRILDLGDSVRSFPKDLKLAILAAARGRCRNAGCDAPYTWLQPDHIRAHNNQGPTSTDNSQGLCEPDNQYKSDRW